MPRRPYNQPREQGYADAQLLSIYPSMRAHAVCRSGGVRCRQFTVVVLKTLGLGSLVKRHAQRGRRWRLIYAATAWPPERSPR